MVSKDFKKIMKNVFFINISEIIFYIIIFICILMAFIGYKIRKKKKENNVKNDGLYIIGSILLYFFGFVGVILLLPVIINILVFVGINTGIEELF